MGKVGRDLWFSDISYISPVKQLLCLVRELSVFTGCLQHHNYAVITAALIPLI